jgi:hypothetical protein
VSYVGKIIISCPRRGRIVKQVKGSSGIVVHKMFTFNPKTMGPACKIVSREIVKSGSKRKGKR